MSAPDRETIYQALFALVTPLKAANGYETPFPTNPTSPTPTSDTPFSVVTREVVEVQRIDPALQPILMMDEAFEENVNSGQGDINYKKLTVFFHIGVTSEKGSGISGQQKLNPLIDAVEAALAPEPGEDAQHLGLGDLVLSATVKGTGMKDHGDNSTADMRQAIYYLPVEIILPA